MNKPKLYRDLIDSLVYACNNGQGQIGPQRLKKGIWNPNEPKYLDEHQNNLNELLKRLDKKDRVVLAKQLEQTFHNGVFETLKTLEEYNIEPFTEGYEGSPYSDFIGRLAREDKWEWPKDQ